MENSNLVPVTTGVFDGKYMRGDDGKVYVVPPNYASKSRLVEGDRLKLYINTDSDKHIYKQIETIPRTSKTGHIIKIRNDYGVEVDGKQYFVLGASISYYHLQPGDEVTAILPENMDATWAAIECWIKREEKNDDIELDA